MWVADGLFWHPKMLKAVTLLKGQASHAEVYTLYVLALAYAHEHLTDGYLPQAAVENLWKECAGVTVNGKVGSKSGASQEQVKSKSGPVNGLTLGEVFSKKTIRLWHPRPGGWEIHDYLKHNPSGSALRTKRDKNRVRQQAWRAQRASLSQRD